MGNVSKRQQPDQNKKNTTAEGHQQVFNVAINAYNVYMMVASIKFMFSC